MFSASLRVFSADKTATLLDFDRVLGLGFEIKQKEVIPAHIGELLVSREVARKNKDWAESDRLREEINNLGYEVLDTDKGTEVRKNKGL